MSRLGQAANVAAIVAVPIAIVFGVLELTANGGDDPKAGPPAPVSTTTATPEPTPEPTAQPEPTVSAQAGWVRQQNRLCRRLNREAAANPRPASADLADQLPTLRGASTIHGEFLDDSAELDFPEAYRARIEVMLGRWSDGTAYMTGMIRAAEQGDALTFDQYREQYSASVEQGMGVARELGATQCS